MKFYPLHWICLSVAVLLSIATMRFGIKELPSLFLNSILLQTWIPEARIYFSFNAVSWYLADTMFFAVIFPFLFKWIMMASKKRRLIIASVITILYAIVAISLPVEKYHAILYIGPYMRLTDFVFGIYLALLYLKLKKRPVKWLNINYSGEMFILCVIVMLVVESCVLPKTVSYIAPVYWVGVSLLIIIAAMTERTGGAKYILENKYLQRLGELSFIIFLIHQLILRCSSNLFVFLKIPENCIYVLFTLIVTLVLSICVEKEILNPITQWMTKKIQPYMTARS